VAAVAEVYDRSRPRRWFVASDGIMVGHTSLIAEDPDRAQGEGAVP
jgi:hypothetical protein